MTTQAKQSNTALAAQIWETLTLSVPSHWLPALINGDSTNLDDREAAAFSRWLYDTTINLGHPVVVAIDSDEAYFARYHDAAEYGVLACMCHDVTFAYKETCDAFV
jgi:hypothetical protein